jgi:hypothetical protein
MSAFTILGILTYWWLMGRLGYVLGYVLCDVWAISRALLQVRSGMKEISVLVGWMELQGALKEGA